MESKNDDNPGHSPGARAMHHLDMAFLEVSRTLVTNMEDKSADGMVGRFARARAMDCLRMLVELAPLLDHDGCPEKFKAAKDRWRLQG